MTAGAFVALAMLIADLSPVACGSATVARERLNQLRQRFQPKITFREACDIQRPAALEEYWGSPPREGMGPWILRGRDGSRVATESIECDFDEADRLVSCTTLVEPLDIQEIALSAYDSVAVGQSTTDVIAKLCEPGVRHQKDETTIFEYWVLQAPGNVHEDCPAYLSFRAGRLLKKQMVCR